MKRILICWLIFVLGCAGRVATNQETTPQRKSTTTKNNTPPTEPAFVTMGIILGAGLIAFLPLIVNRE